MKKYIILIVILAFITSFILGLYMQKLKKINEPNAFEAEYIESRTDEISIDGTDMTQKTNAMEYTTTPNTRVIKRILYKECNHLIENEEIISKNLINKDETEIQNEYSDWIIQRFTPNEVTLYKEKDDFCNEHYLVKDVEGEIIIFGLDKNDDEREVIRETGIKTKYLSDTDISNLKEGIKVFSNKELNTLIEDYE